MANGVPERKVPPFLMAEPDSPVANHTIKVVGIGGGGGNVVSHCANRGINGVEFVAVNTDQQALHTLADNARQLVIGQDLCNGEGVGGDPTIGREAAEESRREIEDILRDTRLLFLVTCLGGGTGTGAAPLVAEIAKELGILTIAVVTKPFAYEGRDEVAEAGQQELRKTTNAILTIPNENIEHEYLLNVFKCVNETLVDVIKAITDLLFNIGFINFDFKDLENNLNSDGNHALELFVGVGEGAGENRAKEAIEKAMDTSKFELGESHMASRSAVVYLTCNVDTEREIGIRKDDMNLIATTVRMHMHKNAQLVAGPIVDTGMDEDKLKVTVIIPGSSEESAEAEVAAETTETTEVLGGGFFEDEVPEEDAEPVEAMDEEIAADQRASESSVRVASQDELTDLPALFKNQAN